MDEDGEIGNQLDPPAGLTFSNVIPVTSLIVDKIGCNGYQILETPHAQEQFVKVTKRRHLRTYPRARSYFTAELTAKRLRILSNSGIAEDLEQFFERNPKAKSIVNTADAKKRTALHFAASSGLRRCVEVGIFLHWISIGNNTPRRHTKISTICSCWC